MVKRSLEAGTARRWEPGLWVGAGMERYFEDPSLRRLYANWLSRRLESWPVRRQDLDPAELEPWLGFLVVYDYLPDRNDYICRVQGERAESHVGLDMQGALLSRYPEPLLSEVRGQYDRVRAAQEPLLVHFRLTAVRAGRAVSTPVRAEKLVLPLSHSDGTIDSFLAAIVTFD